MSKTLTLKRLTASVQQQKGRLAAAVAELDRTAGADLSLLTARAAARAAMDVVRERVAALDVLTKELTAAAHEA